MVTIKGNPLPNIPWEDRPAGCRDIVWRYSGNPIVKRFDVPNSFAIYNSAVVPYKGEFAGVFRVDNNEHIFFLHTGHSKDAIHWDIDEKPIDFITDCEANIPFIQGYDPRVIPLDGKYYVNWCNNAYGQPTIGVAVTEDFQTYHQLENAFLPMNRNGVLFPRKINGYYYMLSRPSGPGHALQGDIWLSASPDLTFWGKHRMVAKTAKMGWQGGKIGAGPAPIETSEGWLLFYHGVFSKCNGYIYSMGAMLLDLDEPWKVIARTKPYILTPSADYEMVGMVNNVAFPCAALTDSATGRIAIYYGAADTVVAVAFCDVNELIPFIFENNMEG